MSQEIIAGLRELMLNGEGLRCILALLRAHCDQDLPEGISLEQDDEEELVVAFDAERKVICDAPFVEIMADPNVHAYLLNAAYLPKCDYFAETEDRVGTLVARFEELGLDMSEPDFEDEFEAVELGDLEFPDDEDAETEGEEAQR